MKRIACGTTVLLLVCCQHLTAAEPTSADYQAFSEYLVGDWKADAGEFSFTINFAMSPTEHCLISTASASERPMWQGIEGYDPEKQCLKRVLFWADGRHTVSETKIETPGEGAALTGLTLKGNAHDVDKEGFGSDSEVVYKVVDQDHWEIQRDIASVKFTRVPKK